MNENDILIAHMNDLASKAVKTGFAASKFLTPAESQSVSDHFSRRKDVKLIVVNRAKKLMFFSTD